MKEKIYTIPVNDAFEANSECPFCSLHHKNENDTIQFIMGPSYMENDVRDETNKSGFCQYHIQRLYDEKNRLGLALMLYTHQMKITKDIKALVEKETKTSSKGIFKKKDGQPSAVKAYINQVNEDCYVCRKIENLMTRYIDTFFFMWKKDPSFQEKVAQSKGLCMNHFAILYDASFGQLKGSELENFLDILKDVYFKNVERVQEDLDWFVKKFDYRYQNEPWHNGKDALPRTITKTNSLEVEK